MVGKSEKAFHSAKLFSAPWSRQKAPFGVPARLVTRNSYTFGSFKSKTINQSFFILKHSLFLTRAMRGQGLFMVEDHDRSGLLVMLPSCTLIELTDLEKLHIYRAQ